jgi:hypothetical protein
MKDAEVKAWIGKPVRVTLANKRVLAGTLHAAGDEGHGHQHYLVVSDPIKEGGQKQRELIHGALLITNIEDASDDPAASE